MTRTKASKKNTAAKSSEDDLQADWEKACTQLKKEQFAQLNALKTRVLAMIDTKIELFRIAQPDLEKTLEELSKQEQASASSVLMRTAYDTFNGSMPIAQTLKKGKKRTAATKTKRSLSCAPDDDGYLTGDSATTRRSRARSRAPLACSTVRASRSLSTHRAPPPPKEAFRTPCGKQPNNYGTITPKIQPNAPQCILRRAKQGEIALSMDGSPLIVNPVGDDTANVNIPLAGGRMISLRPQRGLRLSQVPYVDPETQRQLQTLKEHLDIICAATADK